MDKRLLVICALLMIVFVAGGIAYDRHRTNEREQAAVAVAGKANPKVPPLPQWGALVPAGENTEVSGSAMCGYCTWKAGEPPDNIVLQTSTEPGIVFVLPNEKRTEIEKITGRCAGGDYWITARGTVTQYDGHNYLLVKNFEAVKTK